MNRQIATQTHQQKPTAILSAGGLLQRKCACGNHTMAGNECKECRKKQMTLQRASLAPRRRGGEGEGEVPPIVYEVLRSPGQLLAPETSAFFEPRFGHDFSQVHVHSAAPQVALAALTVAPSSDYYEQEAEQVAKQIMQAPATNARRASSPRAHYDFSQVRIHTDAKAAESARAVNSLAYTVGQDVVFGAGQYAPKTREGQSRDEEGRMIQRKSHGGPATALPEVNISLPISQVADASEQEAERIAEQVMQMGLEDRALPPTPHVPAMTQCESLSGDVSEPATYELSPDFAQAIQQSSGGSSLPVALRAFMEPRFGADFGSVRVHTSLQAATLNRQLHAQAFTYGQDIWLGAGESPANLPLMAHELTHVLQQTPALARGTLVESEPRVAAHRALIQRAGGNYFAPPGDYKGKGQGTKTHETVMPILADKNPDLFFEVNIPGASKDQVAEFKLDEKRITGRADFYWSNTTIGVYFEGADPTPRYLESHKDLRRGKKKYEHRKEAAPAARKDVPKIAGAFVCLTPTGGTFDLCRMDKAASEIRLGDLKPPNDAEMTLGQRQLNNYIAGIKKTADKVSTFAADPVNAGKVDPPNKAWTPSPNTMGTSEIKIPPEQMSGSTSGKQYIVVLYGPDNKPLPYPSIEPAFLYLFYGGSRGYPGIWYYEYVPVRQVPGRGGTATGGVTGTGTLQAHQQTVANNLTNNVIKPLKMTPTVTSGKKVSPRYKPGMVSRPRRRIQRFATDTFRLSEWEDKFYKPWRDKEAKPYLGRKKDIAQIEELDALLAIKKRSYPTLNVPTGAEDLTTNLRKIQHWQQYGPVYGKLRNIFGGVYIKIVGFYERAREKFREALGRRSKPKGGPSGLAGVIIRAAFKILKHLARLVLNQVADRLVESFRSGAESVLREMLEPEIEAAEEHIKTAQAFLTGLEETFRREFEAAVDEIIKPFEEHIETIENVHDLLSDLDRLVNIIKWGARVVACGFPPGIGCLWGVVGTAVLEKIGEKVAESCWFKRDVLFPAITSLGFLQGLPDEIANFILNKVHELLPEDPPQLRKLVGKVETRSVNYTAKDVLCGGEGSQELRPEQISIIRLYEKYGEDTVNTFFKLLEHRGVLGGKTPLNAKHLEMIDELLETTGLMAKDLQRYIDNTPERKPGTNPIQDEIRAIREARFPASLPALKPTPTVKAPRKDLPDDIQRPDGIIIFRF